MAIYVKIAFAASGIKPYLTNSGLLRYILPSTAVCIVAEMLKNQSQMLKND